MPTAELLDRVHVLDSALILPRGSGTRANKRVRGNLLVGEDALVAVQEPEEISEAPVPPELRVLDAGENLSDNLASVGTNGPPPAKRRKRDISPSQNESRSRDRSRRSPTARVAQFVHLASQCRAQHLTAAWRLGIVRPSPQLKGDPHKILPLTEAMALVPSMDTQLPHILLMGDVGTSAAKVPRRRSPHLMASIVRPPAVTTVYPRRAFGVSRR